MNHYIQYAKNIYSDNGEDGILEQLFSDLEITDGIVVEFGAWDGLLGSNTCVLWKERGYSALLMESIGARFNEMKNNVSSYENVETVCCSVRSEKDSRWCLDNIISRSKLDFTSDTFAVVSIDIDSYDYYIFESMERYLPKVVIVETSSGYKPSESFVTRNAGCSLKSVTELGERKGYKLVCHTGNAIFVRNDLVDKLPDADYSIENVYSSPDKIDELNKT